MNTQSQQPVVSNVLFDFCGVLLQWNCYSCLQQTFPELVDQICPNHRGFGKNDACGFYEFEDRMDAGELLDDLMKEYEQRFGKELAEVFRWYIAHYDQVLPDYMPGILELLDDLRVHGYGVWGLTNWSSETFPIVFRKFPVLQHYLQGTIVSGVEHLHKPQLAIYELALRRFNLNPYETVFFDDKPENITGAQRANIHGFVFTDVKQARADLATLGVTL